MMENKIINFITDSNLVEKKKPFKHFIYSWISEKYKITNTSFIYPEITGYYLTLLCFIFKMNYKNKEKIKKKIKNTFLACLNFQKKNSFFQARLAKGKNKFFFDKNIFFSFDNCMMLTGLVNSYKILKTNRTEVENFADEVFKFIKKGNHFAYLKNGKKIKEKGGWSRQNLFFLSKNLISIYKCYEITKNKKFRDFCFKYLEKYIKHFNRNIYTDKKKMTIHLHPIFYFLESVLFFYEKTKKKKYFILCLNTINMINSKYLNKTPVPTTFLNDKKNNYIRNDVVAQYLRILVYLDSKLKNKKFAKIIKQNQIYLEKNINQNSKKFCALRYGTHENGLKNNHLNSWTNYFYLQYLLFKKNYNKISFDYVV